MCCAHGQNIVVMGASGRAAGLRMVMKQRHSGQDSVWRHDPGDLPPPPRPHTVKSPDPPIIVSLDGNQGFSVGSFWFLSGGEGTSL